MIGNFARMVRGPFRALPPDAETDTQGAPPEAFVEKISDDGGDVYIAPLVEDLLALLRRNKDPSSPVPEQASEVRSTEETP